MQQLTKQMKEITDDVGTSLTTYLFVILLINIIVSVMIARSYKKQMLAKPQADETPVAKVPEGQETPKTKK